MHDIFLSYNREDQATARKFAEGFEHAGFSVWWDVTLKSGEAYDRVTEQALRSAKAVVVLWSKRSVNSDWVRAEATIALRNKTFAPVMIEVCERPLMFELTQTADLCHWTGDVADKVWQNYVMDVRRFMTQSAVVGSSAAGSGAANHAGSPIAAPYTPQVTQPTAATNQQHATAKRTPLIPIAIAATLLLGVGAWYVTRDSSTPAASTAATQTTPPAPTVTAPAPSAEATVTNPKTAVAVMAFSNLTGDASKDYLGDGMSEELINVLGKVPGLKVPSRTSTFAYRGRNTDLKQIANDLSVGTVLEGSVRSAGATIRITATLIDAQTDRQLWSETYDREFTDLFKLQDELAQAIVLELQGQLSPAVQQTLANAQPTQNLEAYSLFLRANQLTTTPAYFNSPEQIFDLYDQAIALDPGFAKAYAYKAGMQIVRVLTGREPQSQLGAAEATARQALALDPSLSEANAGLGTIEAFKGNWIAAEQHHAKAASTRTNFDATYGTMLLQSGGYLAKAGQSLRQTYLSAPAVPALAMQLAANYSVMGNDADAQRYINLALDLGMAPYAIPVPQIQANAAFRSGNTAQAAEHLIVGMFPAVRDAGGEAIVRQIYAALAAPDKKPAAVQALTAFIEKLGSANLDPTARKDFIASFTMLGALDAAFDLTNAVLDDYAKSGTVGYAWGALWLPEMKPFRQDPRFQDIAKRLKLFDYWQQFGAPDGCELKGETVACQ
jgi:TolB-like protein